MHASQASWELAEAESYKRNLETLTDAKRGEADELMAGATICHARSKLQYTVQQGFSRGSNSQRQNNAPIEVQQDCWCLRFSLLIVVHIDELLV